VKTYFADTFYFLALLNSRDPHHSRVANFNTSQRAHLVTTLWVLTEVADAMAAPQNRPLFLRLLERLQTSPMVAIIPFSEEAFAAGLRLYREREDKDWPLTDCISFPVMLREGITEALTGDRHFEQAGFVAMLRE
jgi:predicted nucleic acid-binding protein